MIKMKQTHENLSDAVVAGRNRHREQIDLLTGRLGLLEGKTKVMMKMHFENGASFRQIAKLLGVSETSISRRIHKVSTRLIDGKYIACLRNRDRLTKNQLSVAKDYFLNGFSQSDIAKRKHYSLYRVGLILKEVKSIIDESEKETTRT